MEEMFQSIGQRAEQSSAFPDHAASATRTFSDRPAPSSWSDKMWAGKRIRSGRPILKKERKTIVHVNYDSFLYWSTLLFCWILSLVFFSPQSHFWAYRILAKMFHSGRKFPGDKTVSGNGHKRKIGAGKERNGSPQQKKENLSIKWKEHWNQPSEKTIPSPIFITFFPFSSSSFLPY